MTTIPTPILDTAEDLESAVYQALGAASACWEHPEGAGVFDSTRCREIGVELLERIATDRAHLLAEHRAATAELRRLRTENGELRQSVADLEAENELAIDRAEELEALLEEATR